MYIYINTILRNVFNGIAILFFFISFILLLLSIKDRSINRKIVILVFLLFLIPYALINVVFPYWRGSILDRIKSANYCNIDSDCVQFENAPYCGSDSDYVNKKEWGDIKNDIELYDKITVIGRFYNNCGTDVVEHYKPKCNSNKKCEGGKKIDKWQDIRTTQ